MKEKKKCYYDDDNCAGTIWECISCGETFCQGHGYKTELGINIECYACEFARENKEEE